VLRATSCPVLRRMGRPISVHAQDPGYWLRQCGRSAYRWRVRQDPSPWGMRDARPGAVGGPVYRAIAGRDTLLGRQSLRHVLTRACPAPHPEAREPRNSFDPPRVPPSLWAGAGRDGHAEEVVLWTWMFGRLSRSMRALARQAGNAHSAHVGYCHTARQPAVATHGEPIGHCLSSCAMTQVTIGEVQVTPSQPATDPVQQQGRSRARHDPAPG
jgi:hypothetical protein